MSSVFYKNKRNVYTQILLNNILIRYPDDTRHTKEDFSLQTTAASANQESLAFHRLEYRDRWFHSYVLKDQRSDVGVEDSQDILSTAASTTASVFLPFFLMFPFLNL